MKTRQKQLKLFEFEEDVNEENVETFINFIKEYLPLLQRHTLAFRSIPARLKTFLESQNIPFMTTHHFELFSPKENPIKIDDATKEQIDVKSKLKERVILPNTHIIRRVIRSGEEIYNEGDVVITEKVNSGAKLRIKGNLILLDECSGSVEVNGDFIIFQHIYSPALLFGGKLFDKFALQEMNQKNALFKIIFKNNNDISIKELK